MVSVTRVMPELGALIKLDIIQEGIVGESLVSVTKLSSCSADWYNGSIYYFFPSLHQFYLTLFFIIKLRYYENITFSGRKSWNITRRSF